MAGKFVIVLAALLCVGKILTVSGQATHDDLSLQLQRLSETVAVVEDGVEDLEEEVEDVADDIEENMEDEFTEFEEAIEEHLEAVEDEVGSLRQEVQIVKSEVETGLRELRKKAEISEQQIASLQRQVQALTSEVEDGKNNLAMKMEENMNLTLHVLQEMKEWTANRQIEMGLHELKQKVQSSEEKMVTLQEQVQYLTREVENGKNELAMKVEENKEEMNLTLYVLQGLSEQLVGLRHELRENSQSCGQDYDVALLSLPSSCAEMAELNPDLPTGHYAIRGRTGTPVQVYCDMNRKSCTCSNTTVWMQVANLDMTDPAQQCPTAFTLTTTNSKRMCTGTVAYGCTSINFPVHSVQYSKVCGRVRGYQQYSTDAFHHRGSVTIDGNYVDGVSITHGDTQRKHIWTFASTYGESLHMCPCIQPSSRYTGPLPLFIQNDYFCETGSRSHPPNRILYEDPLWDGEGCGFTTSCCHFNSPPWFCKELPQPTTDDIEVRVCTDESRNNEDLHIELIELYVQ